MKIDYIKLFQDYNIKFWIEGKNVSKGWVNITCPLCGDISNHGGFDLQTGKYHCWRCGSHNSLYVLSVVLGKTRKEVKNILKNYGYFSYREELNKEIKLRNLKVLGNSLRPIHRKYLKKRGLNPFEIVKKYKITGFTYENSFWKYRLMIPIYYKNYLVNYIGRDITGKQMRYKNMKNEEAVVPLKHLLYNVDNCKNDFVVVFEGIFDVWKFGDDSIALFGMEYTTEQIKQLLKFDSIYIIFDNEDQAQKKAEKLAYNLAVFGKKVKIIRPEKRKDIGEYTDEEIKELRRSLL